MLDTTFSMLKDAQKRGYAVPAINTQGGSYDIIWACCRAAQDLRSPMILAHYAATGAYSGNDFFANVASWCAKKADVPVAIHLDHGDSFEICMASLQNGFTSLMIDGSRLPLEENAALTNKVWETARCFNVPVEAEIGELLRLDDPESMKNAKNVADPELVKAFLSLCTPDSLAIGIGNAHGYYKDMPNIRLDVLQKVRGLTDIPLVLHGCTGMSETVIRQAIQTGMCKINFGTEIRYKYMQHLKEGMEQLDLQGHSWKLSQYANDRLTEDVKAIIRLAGSEGKA